MKTTAELNKVNTIHPKPKQDAKHSATTRPTPIIKKLRSAQKVNTKYLDRDIVAPLGGDDAVPEVVVHDVVVDGQEVRVVMRVEPCP